MYPYENNSLKKNLHKLSLGKIFMLRECTLATSKKGGGRVSLRRPLTSHFAFEKCLQHLCLSLLPVLHVSVTAVSAWSSRCYSAAWCPSFETASDFFLRVAVQQSFYCPTIVKRRSQLDPESRCGTWWYQALLFAWEKYWLFSRSQRICT